MRHEPKSEVLFERFVRSRAPSSDDRQANKSGAASRETRQFVVTMVLLAIASILGWYPVQTAIEREWLTSVATLRAQWLMLTRSASRGFRSGSFKPISFMSI